MQAATRNKLSFMLDGKRIDLNTFKPTTTVLSFLREHLHRTGTKEGCAEGDCGACTVVIADLHRGGLRYRAINACIQFLPILDGTCLYTVESLKRQQTLHPVQQALLDCHASQCGFCTPGFVMSLFALYKTQAQPSRERIASALSGNLCRCTGYRPILEAGQRMYHYAESLPATQRDLVSASAGDSTGQAELIAQLQALASTSSLYLQHEDASFFAPQTLNELADYLIAEPDARKLAGGTDLGLWVTKQHRDLNKLVYLGAVAELTLIKKTSEALEIGAAVSLEEAYQALTAEYPELDDLYERFASLPIRNAGTLVGNLANGSPIGDSMPALIALGAKLVLQQGQHIRHLALEAFYLGYQQQDLREGEFIRAVLIPLPKPAQIFRTWKIAKRFGQDISAVCAAFALEREAGQVTAIRIAFGGMAAIPKRATYTEQALLGQVWNADCLEQAIPALRQDFQPLTDLRASADYRTLVAANLLRKFFMQVEGQL
ncbi:xanthine dehydrogenase small subunit [Thiothrix eikelboomii]|uniref:xanthine dehydrogenase small subunit n=1 Tax=Thiothrix eikelboomii TaxID=92487 RepID=UPI003BAFF1A2